MSVISSFSIAEYGGLIFGLAYIICAYQKSNYSWPCGILSAICIIIVDVNETHLYFDALRHGFFLVMSCVGLYLWYKGEDAKKVIRISRMPWPNYIGYLFVSMLISGAAGFLFQQQTEAAFPYLDCFQMMLSIFATFLIIYCVLYAWSYWIIVDVISIGLYIMTGAYLLAILYLGYLISNALKWREWILLYKEE